MFSVRPGRKTGARAGASKESAVMARVGRAGRAGRAGGGGRPAAKLAAIAAAVAVIAAAAVVEEDILWTVSMVYKPVVGQ